MLALSLIGNGHAQTSSKGASAADTNSHKLLVTNTLPYSSWLGTELYPGAGSESNQDPDADGLLNLWEYALGFSPTEPIKQAETYSVEGSPRMEADAWFPLASKWGSGAWEGSRAEIHEEILASGRHQLTILDKAYSGDPKDYFFRLQISVEGPRTLETAALAPAEIPEDEDDYASFRWRSSGWHPGDTIPQAVGSRHAHADLARIAEVILDGSGSFTGSAFSGAVIWIPHGFTMELFGNVTVKALVVDGTLKLTPGTHLNVSTIQVRKTGELLADGDNIEIAFGRDLIGDVSQTLVGIFSMGTVRLQGDRIPDHRAWAAEAIAESSSIEVSNLEG